MRRLLILALLFVAATTHAATYYVRTDGSNSNNGLANVGGVVTPGAWLTIAYAESQLTAGDVVRVQAGTYNERTTITPGGSAGNYKTFVADGAVVCRGFTVSGSSYIRIIGFEITHTSTTFSNAVSISGTSSYIEILNCNIHNIYKDGLQAISQSATSYVTIRNCSFTEIGYIAGVVDEDSRTAVVSNYIKPDTSQGLSADHWLVEYCTFTNNIDIFHLYGAYHIARNNYVPTGRTPITYHPDVFQSGSDGAVAGTANHNVEANLTGNMLDSQSHFGIWQDVQAGGGSAGDTNFLIRGNIGFSFGAGAVGSKNTPYVTTYNNTWYKLNQVAGTESLNFAKGSGDIQYPDYAMVANTIIMDRGVATDTLFVQSGTTGAVLTNNLGYQAGSESSYVSTADPQFANAAANDFTLASGSPARGAGTGLVTITTATGSGTSFAVDKPYLLNDGYGITQGDTVTVGATTTVITGISGSTVTVAASVSWTQNVTKVYWGLSSTVDIGALPYGAAAPSGTYTQSGNDYTASVSGSCRFVLFTENGVTQTADYSSPYQYTSSGGTVTVAAYALYASATPVVALQAAAANVPAKTLRNPASIGM